MRNTINSTAFRFKRIYSEAQSRHGIFAHSRALALRGFCLFIIRIINCRTIGKKSRSNTMPRLLVQFLMPFKAALLIAGTAVLLLQATIAYAGSETVIDFIISNNPELQELKAINRNILNMLKVEARSTAAYGQLTREGTSTLDQSKTRYDVGITASIPLISPGEKAQRRIEEAQKERTLRLDVAELLKTYKAEQRAIHEEDKILTSLYNELQWISKRVAAGVDNQKDYNQKLHDYLAKRKDHELKKEQIGLILEKIFAYVSTDKRNQLKGMLNGQDISKD